VMLSILYFNVIFHFIPPVLTIHGLKTKPKQIGMCMHQCFLDFDIYLD